MSLINIVLVLLALAVLFGIVSYKKLMANVHQYEHDFALLEAEFQKRYIIIASILDALKNKPLLNDSTPQDLADKTKQAQIIASKVISNLGNEIQMKAFFEANQEINTLVDKVLKRLEHPDEYVSSLKANKNSIDGLVLTYNSNANHFNHSLRVFPNEQLAKGLKLEPANPYQ